MSGGHLSSERAALIYQHSPLERQKEVAAGIDARGRADRQKGVERGGAKPSGALLVRGTLRGCSGGVLAHPAAA
ncbi:hypothetical protein VT50_0236045 [Streptomyces antioxidans]|uniref:Uncharacterized protein n=1 Tax=Streptomyces antioxidans TaxID=1507734 RepID=A0A1V4CU56_9ACTN|nr:hypothetical protein VT50_0236045 [Streptomyces antioxidans]